MKKKRATCDTSSERKREAGFSYGKCFFFPPPLYKSFLPNQPSPLASGMFHILEKWLLFHVGFPQSSDGGDGTDRQNRERRTRLL